MMDKKAIKAQEATRRQRNHRSGERTQKKTTQEISHRIRCAASMAFDSLAKRGLPLHKMIEKYLESDFLETLKVISKYIPAQLDIAIDDGRIIKLTDTELLEIASKRGSSRIIDAETSEDESQEFH